VPPQQRVQQIICSQLLLVLKLGQVQLPHALSLSNLENGKLAEGPCR
jgi:hypothetical protein